MLKKFITLQWRSFIRSASFQTNLALKILMGFLALYFIFVFSMLGAFSYKIIQEQLNQDPLMVLNRFLVFYLVGDLVMRYLMQRMPVVNIKPLLSLPFSKNKIVHFSLWKTVISFFNIVHAFFFIPFFIVLLTEGYPAANAVAWLVMVTALIYSNNFLNVFLNDIDTVFYTVLTALLLLAGLTYYQVFDITQYTGPVFTWVYDHPIWSVVPVVILVGLYLTAFKYFRNRLYLDDGLKGKTSTVTSEDLTWLNRFGGLAVFLKNDIKLIKRNKRSRTTIFMSLAFIFYGLLFFSGGIEVYEGPVWRIFAGIFVTGGFLFTFGQFVPSWDSSYYPLMMSQNIKYRDYLNSKWWLMVIATLLTTVVASFYLYFGWEVYLAIVVSAIYNIGVNSHVVLWGGAYIKTPIDLTSNKKAFGDKQAFNVKTLLLTIPKLILPLLLYGAGHYTLGPNFGYILVVVAGLAGFAFKDRVFNVIEKVYKSEKYKTLVAYKQKS
ncbi:hypothetical protein E7Z59_03210 [Robertkochia marina]|uniref:Uncharacterized protein n=1 Tax=Robertkochia marina TaxID=1227945 RepID=A0A4V3UYE0_9FLAO|nr:DUF5687 family protein [Robertkochia marina]THD69348.1 hypothetical protein E7Z59_03210 [Robertkochia marina]TRZ47391.1 hypothetical protein D3A96_01375 [Robertkochia marina]